MVRKTYLTILAILGLLAGLIILPQTAAAISLKQNSIVTGDTITLGDVFQGAPEETNTKVLGLAPQPGQDMVLNSRTLLRIATAMNLPWRPATSMDQVVLTRAATIVGSDLVEAAVRAEVEKQGIDGKYNIRMPQASKIVLAPDIAPGVEISDFKMNPATGWFEATASAPSVANAVQVTKVTGAVEKLVDVPVLRGTLKAGDIIGVRDIDYIEMNERDVRQDMILDAEDIIGMSPRRMTTSGKPMKSLDLEAPQMVARGDTVMMTFKVAGMTLTASGKAMENGVKGDTIRVLNTTSNKTVQGFVTASKEVTIQDF